ncbi:ENTH/ANTH/VHS superfamily protein [Rhynchospora pubera]|uniref:ENTH/ANTH/VHS superfamily protein n=1 Tax=Rhynchospora pubera TaxID=906938 RepID=A0AAV8DJV3_9POAL|nr:ENTH/ANTH/VHS superfamily protein [Rhynchospora pubera]
MKVKSKIWSALGSFMDHSMINKPSGADRAILTDIETAIERCIDLHDTVFDERYVHEILFLVSNAPGSITFLSRRISTHLDSTREPVRALKTLLLIHRLLRGGDRYFEQDLRNLWSSQDLKVDPSWLMDYNDEAYALVHGYSSYLEERMAWAFGQSGNLEPVRPPFMELTFRSYNDEMVELLCFRLSKCQTLLDRVMDCFLVNSSSDGPVARSVFGLVLRESFRVYEGYAEGLEYLMRSPFNKASKPFRSLVHEILKKSCLQTPQIQDFYQKCKKTNVGKALDYPFVKIVTPSHITSVENMFTSKDQSQILEEDERTTEEIPIRESKNSFNLFPGKLEATISTVWVEFDEENLEATSL